MSADALAKLTSAIQARIEVALGANTVYVGPPVAANLGNDESVALFLFHIEPNRALRNVEHLVRPAGGRPDGLAVPVDSLPLDVWYLISVFRKPGIAADPVELGLLGTIMQRLAAEPTFTDPDLPGQNVRLTPEPYPMEEVSRVWGLFPTTPYQTSVVYLASPVFITSPSEPLGPPVIERSLAGGALTGTSDPFADRHQRELSG